MYDRIKKLRSEGKAPIVELTPGARVIRHKLPVGRPRKYPPGSNLTERYAGKRGKARPRCAARGCEKMLRINQHAACSEACANRIINDAILRLKQCGVPLSELQALYGE